MKTLPLTYNEIMILDDEIDFYNSELYLYKKRIGIELGVEGKTPIGVENIIPEAYCLRLRLDDLELNFDLE